MPKVIVQVEGYKEVINNLNSLGDTAKRVLEESAKTGAEYLRPIIQSAIPIGDDGKHLKDTVKVKKARLRRRDIQSADILIGGNKDVDYGFHLETGHYLKGKKKRVEGTKVIRTTTDNHAEKVANIVAEHLLNKLGL